MERVDRRPPPTIGQEFKEVFDALPLEKCTLERNPVTGELGWRAPHGWTFKVTGHFEVLSDFDDITNMARPQQSEELFVSEHREAFENFLKETNGNRKEALELLIEDEQDFNGELWILRSFTGKWLVPRPNIDGSPYTNLYTKTGPSLVVKKEV